MAPERPEEFAPGLDPEMQKLADAFAELKKNVVSAKKKSTSKKSSDTE